MPSADGVAPAARAFAWIGMLLFFASLSFFLFSYAVTFGETVLPADGGSAARRWATTSFNVAMFTVFALHHSVFARERVRAWVARLVPVYLERACYVWVASVMFIALCAWWQPVAGVAWQLPGPWRWVGLTAQAVGIWLSLRSAAVIDILELSGVRQLAPRGGPLEFKTTGPYGWVRHPIYTGWCLLVFAVPLMTMTRLVFAVVSSAYLLIAIPFEERSLRRSTGTSYERYMQRVRWKLIPGIY